MLDLTVRYPGQSVADANYPQGKARNRTAPGEATGTPFEADLVNDILGAHQAIVAEAGIATSGVPDSAAASDVLEALRYVAPYPVFADITLGASGALDDDEFLTVAINAEMGGFTVGSSFGVPYVQMPAAGIYLVQFSVSVPDSTGTPVLRYSNYHAFGGTTNGTIELQSSFRSTNQFTVKDHVIHNMTGLTTLGSTIALQNVSGHTVSLLSPSRMTITRLGILPP